MTLFKDLITPKSRRLKIWLDLSTFCNAACPQCHRTDPNGLGKVDWLPLIQWSLKDFIKKFPVDSIDKVTDFEICGTWGEPIMNKDISKICKYIIDNTEATIAINTNGGIRSTDWWQDLGNYCGNRLKVRFDIDGSTNEMHQKYRRGVNLQIVLKNMKALSMTKAKAQAFIILFKHNKDHLQDIINLARLHGASHAHVIKSDRFRSNKNKFYFINEEGDEEVLEEALEVNPVIQNSWIDKFYDR